jgi:ABC-2 type transport system permease protein
LTSTIQANPSIAVLYGRPFDLSTAGGFAAWRVGGFLAVMCALMATFAVVRHTRADEDLGRAELVASAAVGRKAQLAAAIALAGGASLLVGVVEMFAGWASGLPLIGSFAMGVSVASVGWVFTAVAAVAAQVAAYSRSANSMAAGAVALAFMIRAFGDSSDPQTLLAHASWLSPLGWAENLRPFANERWWVLALPLAVTAALAAAAGALVVRRDVGAGLLAQRPGPARADRWLRGPVGLASRLQRTSLAAWVVSFAVCGAIFGSIAMGVGDIVGDSAESRAMFERLGGSSKLVDAYLATIVGVFAMIASFSGLQAVLRLRSEEVGLRAEPLLSTSLGRVRWACSHLIFGFGGSALLVLAGGFFTGLTDGLRRGGVAHSLASLTVGALWQLPACWVVVGLGVACFGLVPSWVPSMWAVAGAAVLIAMFGPVLQAPQFVVDLSPFAHSPKVPGGTVDPVSLVVLSAAALGLTWVGLIGLSRRDIG